MPFLDSTSFVSDPGAQAAEDVAGGALPVLGAGAASLGNWLSTADLLGETADILNTQVTPKLNQATQSLNQATETSNQTTDIWNRIRNGILGLGPALAAAIAGSRGSTAASPARPAPPTPVGQATEIAPPGVPNASGSTVSPVPSAAEAALLLGGLIPKGGGGGGKGGPFGYMTLAGIGTQQQDVANEANAYAKALDALTAPELKSYTAYLNQVTSADPTQRFASIAPAAEGVAQQQEAARKSIATLPRGGSQDYLMGQSYIKEASDIGTLIDQAWLEAQQAKGRVGEFGVRATQAGMGLTESGLAGAAATTAGATGEKYNIQAANEAMIGDALMEMGYLAMLYG